PGREHRPETGVRRVAVCGHDHRRSQEPWTVKRSLSAREGANKSRTCAIIAELRMRLTAGATLGPYIIIGPLGAGGMGEVYRARQAALDRFVAIKVLPAPLAADADARARFEREARAVACLSHPNILAIFDFAADAAGAYVVTELLDGATLRDRLGAGALPVK